MANLARNCRKVVCIGRNYVDHISELGNVKPKRPFFFLKPPTSLLPPRAGPVLKPKGTTLHYEVELGVVIRANAGGAVGGEQGGEKKLWWSNVEEEDAMDAVEGYFLAIDLTARNVQDEAKRKGLPWTIAKGFDTFCPISEFIPKRNLPDPHDATLHLSVNRATRQRDSTALMMFRIPMLIREVSSVMALEEGDLVLTGTPKGVGEVEVGDVMSAGLTVTVSSGWGSESMEKDKDKEMEVRSATGEAVGIEVMVEERVGGYVYSET